MNSPVNDSTLSSRLRKEVRGDVLFDTFSRGRYSTDASIYQVMPLGVVVPRTEDDVAIALQIAREEGVPVLPRGGGTSQNGQTVNAALVIDTSKHLDKLIDLDVENRTACVQPGLVLDPLNRQLKQHGLWFPVDVSTANRATLGGMAGNNSCGARSIRYGNMVHNVRAIEAILADGSKATFQSLLDTSGLAHDGSSFGRVVGQMLDLGHHEKHEILNRFPKLLRRVGGYNINVLTRENPNLAHLLVGSEGTLAWFQRLHLDLQPIAPHKVLGVCHFPTFRTAMESTQHIVELDPCAVGLVDRTMIDLARDIPVFRDTVNRFVQGEPQALLLVEFAGNDARKQHASLGKLVELMGDLGFPGAVIEVTDPDFQAAVWEVRKQGLNIMMSMKGDGKPVSFIEDCAVALKDLADYTQRLTDIFHRHGTEGTFYAHASVGCLHVRPILNMKQADGAKKMRAIAEECFAIVREYKGSHSGEHGDGISRSEFHETMFGKRMLEDFEAVKDCFDPDNFFNPGRITRAPKFDDRTLFRYAPTYEETAAANRIDTVMDWSASDANGTGTFGQAVEMCNNNGACRKLSGGAMCPSYRATKDEQHLTRGRANTLRLALSGQLGDNALLAGEMADTMALCVSCKSCKRECPTGVDMAKMKIEFLQHYYRHRKMPLKAKLIAYLPHYAPRLKNFSVLVNLRDQVPGLAFLSEKLLGFSRHRALPCWQRDCFDGTQEVRGQPEVVMDGKDVVLLTDTFNTYFEPGNARAAVTVLEAAGYRVHIPATAGQSRPLCCGRTFLNAGIVDQARAEMLRTVETLMPFVKKGVPVVGLEPSCLLTLRDELLSLLPGADSTSLSGQALLFEEFLAREHRAGKLKLDLKPIKYETALLHGHCHQKAFDVMSDVETMLSLVPGLDVQTLDTGCCGMAGAFGYDADHYAVSMTIGETDLLPAARAADNSTLLIADGTSCRTQIRDGAKRQALHVARVLEAALSQA